MRRLLFSAMFVLGLGCSSEPPPDSQTPQGGPSADAAPPPTSEPTPPPPATSEPAPTASATAPAPDAHELSLEKADVKKAIGKIMPALRKCLKKASKKDPDLKGQTMLSISIGPDGAVTSVTPSQTEGLTEPMVNCLKSAASKAKFDAPPGGAGATVNLPIELEAKK